VDSRLVRVRGAAKDAAFAIHEDDAVHPETPKSQRDMAAEETGADN